MENNTQLKAKFNQTILDSVEETKKLGYTPTRFIQMFNAHNQDGVEVVKLLVTGKLKISSGLEKLWKKGRLDLTIEAITIRPEFQKLFSTEIIDTCKAKLAKLGYKN